MLPIPPRRKIETVTPEVVKGPPPRTIKPVEPVIDNDDLDVLLSDTEDNLRKLLDSWFDAAEMTRSNNPRKKRAPVLPELRAKLVKAVTLAVRGVTWSDISGQLSLPFPQLSSINGRYPDSFGKLWRVAREYGEDTRKEMRLSTAHKRAVEGWDEPVYFKGVHCGVVRKFSDRLMELLLKGDDPAKFGHAEMPDINIQTNLLMQQLKGTDCASIIKKQE